MVKIKTHLLSLEGGQQAKPQIHFNVWSLLNSGVTLAQLPELTINSVDTQASKDFCYIQVKF
jgi:hypothetical protein